jgi:hypothetical protein
MSTDRLFLSTALGFALLGLLLGEYMGLSGNNAQKVTHAHILLVGFVISFVHAVIHRLWLQDVPAAGGRRHHALHVAGALGMAVGLWAMFGHVVPEAVAGPVLGLCGALVIVAMAMPFAKLWRGR